MDDFVEKVSEALDVDEPITEQSLLEDIEEWDSLGTLAVVSMVSDDYGVTLASEELAGLNSVADLKSLVADKRAG